jgi:hypothetical protein
MFLHLKRILMEGADGGGGSSGGNAAPNGSPAGGAAPSSAQQPAQSQAQGTSITREELVTLMREERNGIFADLRRAGVIGDDSKKPKAKPSDSAPNSGTPSSGPDALKMRSLDRELARAGIASKLNERQYQRLEREFATDNPDDVSGWLKEYFGDLSPAASSQPAGASPAAGQQPSTPQAQNARPVSDAGAPPAAKTPLEEQDLLTMSEADRRHLQQTKGIKWFTDTLEKQVRDKRFKLVK